ACQGGAVTLLDNPTFFQDHAAISMGQYLSIIAVDYKRSHTCFTNGFNDAPDFCDDERSQTFGGLVKNQDIGVGHQGPPDRQHLLLAAGKLLAPVPKTFGKPRKSFKYPFVGPVVAAIESRASGHQQVLANIEVRENATPFGHVSDPLPGDLMGLRAGSVLATDDNLALRRGQVTHDGTDQGGLAHAVTAQ